MLGGHSASRKSVVVLNEGETVVHVRSCDVLGGPEIYSVARREFTAGLPGKRAAKIFAVRLVVCRAVARLCSFSDSTRGQFYGN